MKKKIGFIVAVGIVLSVLFGCMAGCAAQEEEKQMKITALSASGMRQEFTIGETFSTGNMVVTARMEDGTTRLLGAEEYTVNAENCDMYAAGEYEVSVWAEGAEKPFIYGIEVQEMPFSGEYLEVLSGKSTFLLGESFHAKELRVMLHGECAEEVRELSVGEFTVDSSAFDADKEGKYEIVVRMTGSDLTARYSVLVRKDYSKSFKVLAIGNSFSDDATEYLYGIAKAYGAEDVIVGNMYVGGCTLSQHRTYAQNNMDAYEYRKNTSGSMVTQANYRLLDAIRDEAWDVICLQQASQESGQSATYNEDLEYMLNYVNRYKENPECRIAWHMTWAYQQNTTHWAFPVYESDQYVMYASIVNAVKTKIVPSGAFDYIFPVGTAIQNARTSYLGDTLTRDGYHLTLDTGRFIAALTWYLEITGADIEELSVSAVPSSSVAVLDLIKDAVASALRYPYSVTQSEYAGTEIVLKEGRYTQIPLEFTEGYWNAKGENSDEIAEGGALFAATSVRFTEQDLPAGSVIVLEEGWRYRPEAWSEEISFARPDNILQRYTVVDESWWDGYDYRAINLSKLTPEPLTAEEAEQAIKIYIPIPVEYK